jgi:hypothetical protein
MTHISTTIGRFFDNFRDSGVAWLIEKRPSALRACLDGATSHAPLRQPLAVTLRAAPLPSCGFPEQALMPVTGHHSPGQGDQFPMPAFSRDLNYPCLLNYFSFRIEGVKVMPTSNPSGEINRVTI